MGDKTAEAPPITTASFTQGSCKSSTNWKRDQSYPHMQWPSDPAAGLAVGNIKSMVVMIHHACNANMVYAEAYPRDSERLRIVYLAMELVHLVPYPVKEQQAPPQCQAAKICNQHPVDHFVKLVQLRKRCRIAHPFVMLLHDCKSMHRGFAAAV